MTGRDPEWIDDVMAIADAVGVTAPRHPELDARHVPHPCYRHEFEEPAFTDMLAAWSRASVMQDFDVLADRPIPYVPVVDHAGCEGEDCTAVICACPGGPCVGTTVQACPHHELLCEEHRLACVDCVQDYIDGGAS